MSVTPAKPVLVSDETTVKRPSREQALEEFQQLSGLGEALKELPENPLPGVILVTPDEVDKDKLEALRQQLAPHKRQADKLEQELGKVQEKLAAVESQLGDSGLYEAARKDELRELLAEQAALKTREAELEETWLEALETLEALQQQLEDAE